MWFRYTSLIDPYIPCIAVCLKDESVLIRRQTFTLLTHLLQVKYSPVMLVSYIFTS